MKQLTCEMCGSNDLLKQEGVFVCQTCGTKYSVEEAKKMMIEGTVEVTGTVKIDESDKIEKLYQLARRAKENNQSQEAIKYYDAILCENPNDWEAAFFKLYFSTIDCKLGEIPSNLYRYANGMESILVLITEMNQSERDVAMNEVFQHTLYLDRLFTQNIATIVGSLNSSCNIAKRSAFNTLGDLFATHSNDGKKAIRCYEISLKNYGLEKDRAPIIAKIRRIDPSHTPPAFQKPGCYVATCVYGSYDCPQVWTLRRYRDDTLGSTWYGRLFIRTYYAISPTLVKWFGNTNWFKKMWKGKLDRMVAKLQSNGVEDTPYEDKNW